MILKRDEELDSYELGKLLQDQYLFPDTIPLTKETCCPTRKCKYKNQDDMMTNWVECETVKYEKIIKIRLKEIDFNLF